MAKQLHAIGPVLVPTVVYNFLQGLEIDFNNKAEIEAKIIYYTNYLEVQPEVSNFFGGLPDEIIKENSVIKASLNTLKIIKEWK